MKIYTRTGDRGTSVLLASGQNRLRKDSLIFDVLGTLDELSSVIGVALSTCSSSTVREQLQAIQHDLFDIGSCLASSNRSPRFQFKDINLISNLEKQIDSMTEQIPPLRNFILPGGSSPTGSHLHLARSVCRRTERLITKWFEENASTSKDQETVIPIYINRLSDYLFTVARFVTVKEGHREINYFKRS